jgi:hypothetical protein
MNHDSTINDKANPGSSATEIRDIQDGYGWVTSNEFDLPN